MDLDAGGIKDLAFEIGGQVDNLFLLLASEKGGKAILSCYISKGLVADKDLNAGTIVRELGKYIQGGEADSRSLRLLVARILLEFQRRWIRSRNTCPNGITNKDTFNTKR